MDQSIYLIDANPFDFSIDKIYSILWLTISKTYNYYQQQRIFICPHTVQISINANQIYYQPQNCQICSRGEFNKLRLFMDRYKYMICGILYFLLEGGDKLQEYYRTQDYYFFKDLHGYFNQDENFLRSICQILTLENFEQRQQIANLLPAHNKPEILICKKLTRYYLIVLSPCLGTPQQRKAGDHSVYFLTSFQRLLFDLRQIQSKIQKEIGMNNSLPPPCLHNLFIGKGYNNYCQFRINIYQTNPICKCQNRQMGRILKALIEGQSDNDQIIDDTLLEFSNQLIERYEFNNSQEQFEQYNKIIEEINKFRQSMSIILENYIEASFYANPLRQKLVDINENNLWGYYKILFLQEMIELLENSLLANSFNSNLLFLRLIQLKQEQTIRIMKFLQIQNVDLLSQILLRYREQIQNQNILIQHDDETIQQQDIQFPQLFLIRQGLFQQFSKVEDFTDQNNQFFRTRFNNDFNLYTIIEFEDSLKNDIIQNIK